MTATTQTTALTHAQMYEKVLIQNVRSYLVERGIPQQELAAALNIRPSSLSMKMRGKNAWSLADLVNTADFLGVRPEDLLDDSVVRASRAKYGVSGADSGAGPDATAGRENVGATHLTASSPSSRKRASGAVPGATGARYLVRPFDPDADLAHFTVGKPWHQTVVPRPGDVRESSAMTTVIMRTSDDNRSKCCILFALSGGIPLGLVLSV